MIWCRYAFCRVADDLVDDAPTAAAAEVAIEVINHHLSLLYADLTEKPSLSEIARKNLQLLPQPLRSAFHLLATLDIPRAPLDELVTGFRTDLRFDSTLPVESEKNAGLPIRTDTDLVEYSQNVASSVAELCVRLVWKNEGYGITTEEERRVIIIAAREMGVALQLVNICRDVPADLKIGRMYLPGVSFDATTEQKTFERRRLLELAEKMAIASRSKIELLPLAGRNGIRAACAVYLQIGEAVLKDLNEGKFESRASASKLSRFRVAWNALS